jgi:nitroreductase
MQLWEFYRIRSEERLAQMGPMCLGQNAAKTANELVVVAVRQDLWRERCDAVIGLQVEHFREAFGPDITPEQKRILHYWEVLIPKIYTSGFGLFDLFKRVFAFFSGIKAPMSREVTSGDMRISAHRSVGLAAMTFMWSMASEGYDSCPMEGFDSKRVKAFLGLPGAAEISMIIAVGTRAHNGVYGPRLRLPLADVYREI